MKSKIKTKKKIDQNELQLMLKIDEFFMQTVHQKFKQ